MARRRIVTDPRFATRLRELRQSRGLSLHDLARRAYVSRSHISELERGIKTPGRNTAQALDQALGAGGELAGLVREETRPHTAPDDVTLGARSLLYHPDATATLRTITEMGRADVNRRKIIAAPFVLAALAAPSRDWLLASLAEVADERGPRQVGMEQVQGIRDMFALFQELDVMRGGGHARPALVEYMNSYVLPLVSRDHGSEQVQKALYEAAAEQAYLVGWMAYDDGLHGLAERYLIQSLRLAQASGNRVLGAHVLAGMSDQANLLGGPREALMLALAGQRGIHPDDSPACMTDLLILEARALAALGETAQAAKQVAAAEAMFARIDPEAEPEWARFIDAAYVFGEAAHCFRDAGDVAQIDRFATESAEEAARQRRARRGALSHAALATGLLMRGEPEAAAATGMRVVDLAAAVNSSRCLETVRTLVGQFAPYGDVAEVVEFREHARERLGITT
ncbi:MAG: helix-turn-helix domain-containing protein [Limnochordales bacterium]